MTLSELLDRIPGGVEAASDGYLAHCPSHEDSNPSLRVAVGEDKVLLKCRAGCKTEDVLAALGLTMRDLATMKVDKASAPARRASTDAPASPAAVAALAADLDRWHAAYFTDEAAEVREYAARRFGVTDEDARRLGLGAMRDGSGWRLVVPFRDPKGVPGGYQARALDKHAKVRWKGPRNPEDGGSWAKIGWLPGSAGWSEVIVCEGPGDAVTAAVIGYDAIIVRGAALARNPKVLDEIAAIVGDRKTVIAGDGDEAGWDFSAAMSRGLIERDVSAAVLDVPDGHDLTSWREVDPGARAIVEAITSSRVTIPTSVYGRELDEERYPLTDVGAARWLRDYIRRQGRDVRWTPEAGFYLLTDGVWRKDELDEVRAFAQDAFEDMGRLAEAYLESAIAADDKEAVARAQRRLQHARRHLNTRPMDDALRQLRALRDVATGFDAFDRNPDLLAFRNGVVNLRTGELMPHNGAYMLTRRVEYNYRPEARAPRWEQYLREVFPNHPELPDYMQRLVGYGITGHTEEQCFVILWGRGANGKSVFTQILTEVFRDITVTTPFQTFEARPSGGVPNDLAALKGARLVVASEGEADKPMAEAVLKRVTGRDLISARFMRQEFFEFRPTFLLWLATNNKPRFKGQDEGLWRRVKLIPWERYFAPEERDHYLEQRLLAEAEGIVAWAVRGAVRWYAEGLRDPECVVQATAEYRATSNALDGFLPGVWEPGQDDDVVEGHVLYDSYLRWADEENLSPREIWTRRTFYVALEERGLRKTRRASGVAFQGIRKAGEACENESRNVRTPTAPLAHYSDDSSKAPRRIRGASLDDVAV